MKNKIKTVCIYGGASEKIDEKYKREIEKLGKLITDSGCKLVYGAGATGLMGAAARGIHSSNGHVTGVTPEFMSQYEPTYPCDVLLRTETMSERKDSMESLADIFVIVPGGIGTMDEFFQVLTLKQLKQTNKPIILLNINGFYEPLIELLIHFVKTGFTGENVFELFNIINDVDNIKPYL